MVNYPYSKEEIDMKKYSVWKRLGSLVLALVLVMSLMPATHTHAHAEAISGGTKLFLKPNANWTQADARFAMYLWGDGGNIWAGMTDSDGDGVYEGTAPAGSWTNVIFCRMNPATTVNDWDSKWDQTVDLTCDYTDNTFTVADGAWNNASGTWSHTHSLTSVTYPEGSDNIYATCHTPVYSCPNCPDGITQKGELEDHSFTDSKCDQCGYVCGHLGYMGGGTGACSNCGWECDHPSWTEINGYATCYYCGIDAVAKVVDTYYLDIGEALAKAQETDGCTLTLYQNVSGLTKTLTVSKGNFTILGNSNTLSGTMEGPVLKITGGTVLLRSLKVENPSTATASRAVEITGGDVTVRGGAIIAGHSGIFIPLDSDPTVTLVGCTVTGKSGVDNNSTASTLNLGTAAEVGPTIQGTTYGVSSRGKVFFNSGSVSGEYGFYLVPGASVTLYDEYYPINATAAHFFITGAPTGELNFHYAPSAGKYKIKATLPGTFAKPALSTVELDPAGFISVTDGLLLAKDGDNLILKQCGHETIESEATCKAGAICAICGAEVGAADPDAHIFDAATGKCGNGCGLEMAAASTTVGSTTTYYLTVQAALDAASQAETATVKLLRSDENVTGLTMMGGNVRLEMNGLTLKGSVSKNGILQLFGAELSVVGGTVENTAADGYGIYAAYNESTHRYSTIDVDSSTVTGGDAGIVTYKAHVSLARGTVTGTRFGIAAQNSGGIVLESGTVRGDVGVSTSFYGGTITLGAEGTDGPTVYGQTCGIATNYDTTAYSGTINCPEGTGINLSWHYSGQNESAGAGLYLEGTPTINAATDIYLDYGNGLVDNRYIQVNVALTDGAYSVDCQMDNDVIAKPGPGITLQRTWFTSANANKFVQHSAHGYLGLGPCAHSDKKAVQNEDGVTHDVFCNICQTTPEEDVPCSGGTATCKNKAVCTACGEQYGELADHIIDPDTGKCSLCNTDLAVALVELNDTITYYATVQEALDAVQTATASQDATVLLRKEHKANSYLFIRGGEFTLDLGGNTLDIRSYGMDMNAGQVQIVNGKIIGDYLYVMQIKDGKLTVGSNATLQSIDGWTGACGVLLIRGGEAILDGGILTTNSSTGVYAYGGNFTLTSGKVEHTGRDYAIFVNEGTVLLNGGTVTGGYTTIYVKSGDNTLTLGGAEVQFTATKKSDAAIVQGGGTVNLNSGTVSSGSSVVQTAGGTLNVGGTVMTPAAGRYHVYAENGSPLLNFSKATGKEYKIYAGRDLPTDAVTHDSEKHLLTYTDTDITDGTYAQNTVVTLGCPHKNTTVAPNGDGTHKVTCDDCDATVAENEACSGGTATCIAKAVCAKCETEYGNLADHSIVPNTGKCQVCNHQFAATLKTGSKYKGFDSAQAALDYSVNNPGELYLWADGTLSKKNSDRGVLLNSLTVLNLNGYTLSTQDPVFFSDGTLTISGSEDSSFTTAQYFSVFSSDATTELKLVAANLRSTAASGKGALVLDAATLDVTSGSVVSTNAIPAVYAGEGAQVKITDCSFQSGGGFALVLENMDSAQITGGEFAGGIKVNAIKDGDIQTLANVIPEGYRLHDLSGVAVSKYKTQQESYCAVRSCDGHQTVSLPNSDGFTHITGCWCGYGAVKENCSGGTATCIAKAVCAKCETEYGQLGGHGAIDPATGKCSLCNTDQAVASATLNGATTYYTGLQGAIEAVRSATASDNATVTLLKEHKANNHLFIMGGVFTLDLGGNTLSCKYTLAINGGDVKLQNGTLTGSDTSVIAVHDGRLTVAQTATVENTGNDTSTTNALRVEGGTAILDGGTLISTQAEAAVSVNSGTFTLNSGKVEHTGSSCGIQMNGGTVNLNGGSVSSARRWAVHVFNGTLKVKGTALNHLANWYDVRTNFRSDAKLDFTAATGTKYTVEVNGFDPLPLANLTYSTEKYSLTHTDTDITDNSYAPNTVITLSCAHNGTTAAPNGDGTHKVTCSNCGATVAESEACSGGTATCIALAKCAKCEGEHGQLLEHAMDADTGKCKYGCGLLMAEAYVTGGNKTTYYLTFEEAFANTMSTHSLCLLKDATVESALSSVNMRELFLNGHTLTLNQGMTVDELRLSGTGGTLKGGSDCEVLLQATGDLELVNVSVLAEGDHAVNAATLTLREATLSSDRAEIYITEFPSSGPAIDFETPYNGSALRVEFAENMYPLGMLLAEGDYYLPEDQIEIFNEGYTVSHLPSDGTDGRALYVCADLADAQIKNAPFAITYGEDIQAVLPELTLLGRNLTKNIDYTLTYPTVTGAGTVNIIATGTSRYVGELKIPVTVNKAAPKYSDFEIFSPADLVYNGQPKVPQIDTTRTGMGQWTVRYLNVEESTLESNAVDAGTYQIVLNVAEGENYTDSTVTNPFWTFQITKADVTLRMQEPNTTTPYAINKPVQIIATGADGTILGAEVTLRMIDDGREARADEKKTVDSTGTATYENLSEKESGKFMKPGTYTVRAAIAESKNHKAASFTQLGTYTITKADLTVTKTSEGSSNKYGHNLYGVASVTGVTDDVNGLSIQLQLKNAEGAVVSSMTQAVSAGKIVWNWLNELSGGGYADAGEYTIVAKFDGNAIYEASETNLGTYTILPTPATVTAADQTITLGESISTDEDQYEVEGLLVGYRLTAITLTPSTNKVTASGEIIPMDAVIKRGDVDVTANYDITYKSGKLIVKPDASLVDNLEVETVTSEDLPDIEEFLEQMENAESTEEEWDDLLDHANDLAARVEDAAAMADTDVDDLTEDTVRPETVEEAEDIQGELEAAKEQLERAKEYFGDNYTDEEETAIEDELKRVEDLLDKVEKVKPFIEAINELPETAEPDDEEAIRKLLEAVAIGNRIGEEARALAGNMDKLEKLLTDLTNYRIILGDGGKYTKGSGEALSFTANGPYKTEEVFFVALFVDGERVAEENYTAVAGSTVVTLKPEYLNSLKVGEHTLYFSYQFSGMGLNSNTAEFTVEKKAADNDVPGTGDDSQLVLWICVGSVALVTMIVLMILLLKKKGKYEMNKR